MSVLRKTRLLDLGILSYQACKASGHCDMEQVLRCGRMIFGTVFFPSAIPVKSPSILVQIVFPIKELPRNN